MKRGEIYLLNIPDGSTTGCEIKYDRPAIIVSCNNLSSSSGTVTVVPCSTSQRNRLRYHVHITSAARDCHAQIEQITTVDKSRMGRCFGAVSPDELKRIDADIADFLALPCVVDMPEPEIDLRTEPATITPRDTCGEESRCPAAQYVPESDGGEVDALRTELGVYKQLYNDLLGRVMKSA